MLKSFNDKSANEKMEYLEAQFSYMLTERKHYEDIWSDVDKFVQGVFYSYDSKPINRKRYEDVYDGSIMRAVRTAASSYSGLVWKKFGNSIRVRPDEIEETNAVKQWFDDANDIYASTLDSPEVDFDGIITKSITDGLLKSTMAGGAYIDEDDDLFFKSHPGRYLYFKENVKQKVDFIALRDWKPVFQVVEEYGFDNVGEEIQAKYKDKSQVNSDIEVIHFIIPNTDKRTKQEKPFLSVHIAQSPKQLLKDSFLDYLPIKIARFYNDETGQYGTSPCMDSVMTIMRNNAITGEVFETAELNNRPAMSLYVDQVAGDGNISIAPNAVNQFNSSTSSQSPMSVLYAGGNPTQAWAIRQDLKNEISEALNLDVLLDFNNQTQMTATEASIRDNIRSSVLNTPLSSIITKFLNPLVEEGFNLKFQAGHFGLIPGTPKYLEKEAEAALKGVDFEPKLIPEEIIKAIQEGKSIYKIDYLTPAARLLQAQENESAFNILNFTATAEQIQPGVSVNVDIEETLRDFVTNAGRSDNLRSKEEVKQINKERAKEIADQQARDAAQQNANIAQTEQEVVNG